MVIKPTGLSWRDLSPVLFVVFIELWALAIRQNEDIQGGWRSEAKEIQKRMKKWSH